MCEGSSPQVTSNSDVPRFGRRPCVWFLGIELVAVVGRGTYMGGRPAAILTLLLIAQCHTDKLDAGQTYISRKMVYSLRNVHPYRPPQLCALLKKTSVHGDCELGITFGCAAHSVWIFSGCRGIFLTADNRTISCGNFRGWPMKCFATAGEPAEDAELERREEEVDAEWREKLEREWRAKKLKDEFRRKRYPLPACSAIGRFTVYEVHDSLSHGDVCRNPREPGRFECPEGCNRMPGAPFCASNESVPTAEVPCHAPNARDALRLPGMLAWCGACTNRGLGRLGRAPQYRWGEISEAQGVVAEAEATEAEIVLAHCSFGVSWLETARRELLGCGVRVSRAVSEPEG